MGLSKPAATVDLLDLADKESIGSPFCNDAPRRVGQLDESFLDLVTPAPIPQVKDLIRGARLHRLEHRSESLL